MKHVEFYSKNKFEELERLVGLYYKNLFMESLQHIKEEVVSVFVFMSV